MTKARCQHGRPWFGYCLSCQNEEYIRIIDDFLDELEAEVVKDEKTNREGKTRSC